ncbi:MAG TPA: hypothetical protein VEB22_15390 [Phycisphaerales bacterium]|nr:hypothetical protein [Phycisphaerales bacterium]
MARTVAVFDARGNLVPTNLPPPAGVARVRGDGGSVRHGLRRLSLARAIASGDPGSRLTSALTDGGDGVGITWPLAASWGSTDWAGAYPYLLFDLTDIFGFPLSSGRNVGVALQVIWRTPLPGAGPGAVGGLCLVNETGMAGGTIDGRGLYVYTSVAGGVPGVGSAVVTNGSCSLAAGASASSNRSGQTIVQVDSSSSTARAAVAYIAARDANGAFNAGVDTTTETEVGNPSKFYLAMFAGRSTSTAEAVTCIFDAYAAPITFFPYRLS